jgi:hypothetical protein
MIGPDMVSQILKKLAKTMESLMKRCSIMVILKVKFGVVIPQFNAMYEIYNKTPLLPYIIRPKLYEANAGNTYDLFDMLPQKALIHLNGTVPVKDMVFEYALYAGNPPNNFIFTANNPVIMPSYVAYGQSAVDYVSYGGRVGITNDYLRAGVSISGDKENQRQYVTSSSTGATADLGDLNRMRFGADLQAIVGAGYRVNDAVVLKMQAINITDWCPSSRSLCLPWSFSVRCIIRSDRWSSPTRFRRGRRRF